MNTNDTRTLVSFAGLGVRPEIVTQVEVKAAKLHRHRAPCVGTLRVNIRYETPHSSAAYFAVCAQAEARGMDYVVHARAAEPGAAINGAFAKLERSIAGTAGALRHRRHEPTLPVRALQEIATM
jgi:ribosome-associated translation inhibitor RaiA